jgi:hypothetical protein
LLLSLFPYFFHSFRALFLLFAFFSPVFLGHFLMYSICSQTHT